MEVTSLVVAWCLVGQTAAGPFDRGTSSGYAVPGGGVAQAAPFTQAAPISAAAPYTSATAGNSPTAPGLLTAAQTPTAAKTVPQTAAAAASPATTSPPQTLPPQSLPSQTAPPQALPPSGAAPRAASTAPAKTTSDAAAPAGTAPPSEDKSGASALVRESLVLPKSLSVAGRKTTLLETISYVGDRRRQTEAVRAFWRLSSELADYHFAWQHAQFLKLLDQVVAGLEKGPDLQAAKAELGSRSASAEARLREAQLRLVAAQYELSQRALLPAGQAQPVPDDLPHVGVYHTYFDKLYAGRAAPSRAYLLNRTLPQLHELIGLRAQAVHAAQDAYDAAFEAYRRRQLPLDDVLEAVELLRDCRSDFIEAVRNYNEEIAEYALMSAPEGIGRETLVGMLVKTSHTPTPGKAAVIGVPGDVVPAAYIDGFGVPFQDGPDTSSVHAYDVQPVPDPSISGAPSFGAAPGPFYAVPSNSLPVAPTNPGGVATIAPATNLAGPVGPQPTLAPPLERRTATTAAGGAAAAYSSPAAYAAPSGATSPPTAPGGVVRQSFEDSGAPPLFTPPESARPLTPATPDRPAAEVGAPTNSTNGSSLQFVPAAPSEGAAPSKPTSGQPTLAPPRVFDADEPRYKVNRVPFETPSGTPPYSSGLPTADASTPAPLHRPAAATTEARETNSVAAAADATTAAVQPVGYYSQVIAAPADRRAQELVETLHRGKSVPDADVRPITLDECMSVDSAERAATIADFWIAAEQAARYRIAAQTAEQLEALQQSTLRFRDSPAGAVAMLRVQAAKLDAEARRLAALHALTAARWKLTDDLRRPLGEPWLSAETLPHAGGYKTKLESLPPSLAQSLRLRRVAERIPALHEAIELRADAALSADAAVDFALGRYGEGRASVRTAVAAIERRDRETSDLLAAVTRYNVDIADYALSVLPASAPRDTLVGALVVHRATTSR